VYVRSNLYGRVPFLLQKIVVTLGSTVVDEKPGDWYMRLYAHADMGVLLQLVGVVLAVLKMLLFCVVGCF